MKALLVASIIALLTITPGCSQETDEKSPQTTETKAPTKAPVKETEPVKKPEPVKTKIPEKAPAADYFYALVMHEVPKPSDPVKVEFPNVTVTKATFDPANLQGGAVELSIDIASLKSGIGKRDGHLASPDYFDAAKRPAMTVSVGDIVKKAGDAYTAKATVSFGPVKTDWAVSFTVVGRTADGVRIQAEHKVSRSKLGIGVGQEGPADEALVKLMLTLSPTS